MLARRHHFACGVVDFQVNKNIYKIIFNEKLLASIFTCGEADRS